MQLSYYIFAFFLFALVCIVLFLCRYLFSDLKRQNQILDEKERKLLRLYQSVEEVMDEFYDSVKESKGELESSVKQASEKMLQSAEQAAELKREQAPKKSFVSYLVDTDGIEQEMTFGQVMSEASGEDLSGAVPLRNKNILQLHREGKARIEIAKDLGITLAEVDLVIGIAKKTSQDRE